MDVTQHFNKIVEGLVADISCNVVAKLDGVISTMINQKLSNFDFDGYLKDAAANAFNKKVSDYSIDPKKLENKIVDKINTTIDSTRLDTLSLISSAVKAEIDKIDVRKTYRDAISNVLSEKIENYTFPANSINAAAINLEDFVITGNNIVGGIIKNFSSTGIDDRSSQVALTILDHVTVVENNLLTQDLTVEGSMTVNGSFIVNGEVPSTSEFFTRLVDNTSTSVLSKLDGTFFNNYSQIIFNKIKDEGLDLNKISLGGTEVIKNNSLSSAIVESNLQKLGLVKELQVSGETLLAGTLYVTNRRVGVNTIEPSAALSVWDDEVEIILQKKSKDIAYIGTSRKQKVILSSNSKENVILDDDGSTQIDNFKIGSNKFTSASSCPGHISERGHIVWNNNPNFGGPIGWVCLGGANWANFGIID